MIAVQVRYSVEAGVLLLALCVIIGPLIAERARIPGLVGLIAAGTVLGPNVLEWLQPGGFVATLGAAGLLYLMFVAGVELDLKTFAANRHAAVTFGLLTFIVPFGLSYMVGRYYLDLGLSATALVGAMWASHTIVAYPEVKTAGIDRSRAVGVSLAATVITDVIALVILAIAASSSALQEAPEVATQIASGTIETSTTLPLWVGLALLVAVCFGVIPRVTKWLFAHVLFRRSQRFVWALVAMSAGAIVGLLGGIEGLVGAFLAGIGMNPSVPARSELMERIEFMGSALLIPAFLISVGLSIDPVALIEPSTIAIAAVFVATVIVGKVLAAIVAGAVFSFDRHEIAVMATLTIGQAAATLAIAQVGVETGLFDDEIRNAAIVTVVVTVLVTSFGTRFAARGMHLSAAAATGLGDHVLVLAPIDDVPIVAYASLAAAMVGSDGGIITPCAVRTRSAQLASEHSSTSERLRALDDALVRLGHDTEPVHRVADSLANGLAHLADEVGATLVVVPVARDRLLTELGRGGELGMVVAASATPVIAVSMIDRGWERLHVVTAGPGDQNHFDADDLLALEVATKIAAARSKPMMVHPQSGESTGGVLAIPETPGLDGAALTSRFRAGDLLVAPLDVLTREAATAADGAGAIFADVAVIVVSGPAASATEPSDSPEAGAAVVSGPSRHTPS